MQTAHVTMLMKRRTILKQVGAAVAGAVANVGPAMAEPASADTPSGLPEALAPYLQHPAADGMTVCFLARGASGVRICWAVAGGGPSETDATGVPIPGTPWTRWSARITGLKPGAVVSYEVLYQTDGKIVRTPANRFKTLDPAAPGVRFAVFNDIHDQRATITALCRHFKPEDCDFVVFNGDMFNDPSAADGARKVFGLWDFYIRLLGGGSRPILFVRGNHETRGGFKDRLNHLFQSPDLTPDQPPAEQLWRFDLTAGPAYLVFMDTGEDDGPETPEDSYKAPKFWQAYRRRDAAWLRDRLAAKPWGTRPWRIFVSHIPLHNPAGWFSIGSRDAWLPPLREAGISLMLAGHDHAWKFLPAGKEFPIAGKSGATDKPDCPVLIGGGPSMKEGTVILVDATRDKLTARMLDTSGKPLHEFTTP